MPIILTQMQIEKFAEALRGTCQPFEYGFTAIDMEDEELQLDDLSKETLEAIDDIIFSCDECDWWCENSEMHTDPEDENHRMCEECYDHIKNNQDLDDTYNEEDDFDEDEEE